MDDALMTMKKTKILFLIGSFAFGGKERQLHVIMEHLSREKYEVYLLFKSHDNTFFNTIKDKLNGYKNLDQAHFNFKSVVKTYKYIQEVKPDIVFSFAYTASHIALICKFFSSLNFRLFNGAIRNAPDRLNLKEKIESLLYRLYRNVVANSYAGLKSFRQLGKRGRHVLYNGCYTSETETISRYKAQESIGFAKNSFHVIMVASLRRDNPKDPITFLKAAQEVQPLEKDIQFHLVGGGEMLEELKNYVQTNHIHNVEFLGYRSDIPDIVQAAHLSVLTSRTEGVSNSILESMSFGIPVIATSGGGTPEVIVPNENGFILPFQDYKGVAALVIQLKNNPSQLHVIGEKAKQTVMDKFSIRATIQRFEEIIHSTE
ncbi:MAG: glycosyltransferase family 4 protein [Bacteroidetes bacterium]|nr:glycosyltransferase family 4 protein [Bacteroidota bacterium]